MGPNLEISRKRYLKYRTHFHPYQAVAAAEEAQETLAAVTTEVEEETAAQIKKLKKKAKVRSDQLTKTFTS